MRKLLTLTAAAALVALSVGFTAPANAIDLSAGLVGYWPFDDGADPTDDASVNANTGILGNGAGGDVDDPLYDLDAADIAPVSGNVSSLDFAAGDFVRVTDTTDLEPTDVSVSVWVRNDGAPTSFDYILAKTRDGGKASYALYTAGSGGLFFYASNAGAFFLSDNAGAGIWDGSWHHIAGIYDSSGPTVHLFVDGVEVGTPNVGPGAIDYVTAGGFGDFTIGTYNDVPIADWIGNIDEVRVYDRVLTQEEIEALASDGITDPTDDAREEIDISSVEVSNDGTTLSCMLFIATDEGLLDRSTFRCHFDFDDVENSDEAGKGCDLEEDTDYSLGTNSLCTTSDITLTYRPTRNGGFCTGLPSIICSEQGLDGDGVVIVDDDSCDGNEESCKINIDVSLADLNAAWVSECGTDDDCLTSLEDKDLNDEYDVFMFFDSQYKGDRDRVPDTFDPDNSKPNEEDEVVVETIPEPAP